MLGLKTILASALVSMAVATSANAQLPEWAARACTLGRACVSEASAPLVQPLNHRRNSIQPTICLDNPPFFCTVNGE
jgi:negative regulator of sigma E activity